MKQLIIQTIILIIAGLSGRAQSVSGVSHTNYEQLAQKETDYMNSKLNLGPIQLDSVAVINRDYYFRVSELSGQTLSVTNRGQRLQQVENERKLRLNANLTLSQYNQYFELIEASKRRFQQRADSIKTVRQRH